MRSTTGIPSSCKLKQTQESRPRSSSPGTFYFQKQSTFGKETCAAGELEGARLASNPIDSRRAAATRSPKVRPGLFGQAVVPGARLWGLSVFRSKAPSGKKRVPQGSSRGQGPPRIRSTAAGRRRRAVQKSASDFLDKQSSPELVSGDFLFSEAKHLRERNVCRGGARGGKARLESNRQPPGGGDAQSKSPSRTFWTSSRPRSSSPGLFSCRTVPIG